MIPIPRNCRHCSSDISNLRSNAKFCGTSCKDDYNNEARRLAKSNTKRTMTCARQGCSETFTEGDGRKYCSDKCNSKVQTKKRNADILMLQKRLTAHLFSIRHDGPASIKFIHALINTNNSKIKRLFGANYLYLPRRDVRGVRTTRRDLTRSEKIKYNRILRDKYKTFLSNLFHGADIGNRTIVEICDSFCHAVYKQSVKSYRYRREAPVALMIDTLEELSRYGIPDWIMRYQPLEYSEKRTEFTKKNARPEALDSMLIAAEAATRKEWEQLCAA